MKTIMENSLSLYLDQCSRVYYDLPISLVSYHIFQMNSLSPSILKNITKVNRDKNNFKECSLTENNTHNMNKKKVISLHGQNLVASLPYLQMLLDPLRIIKYCSIITRSNVKP